MVCIVAKSCGFSLLPFASLEYSSTYVIDIYFYDDALAPIKWSGLHVKAQLQFCSLSSLTYKSFRFAFQCFLLKNKATQANLITEKQGVCKTKFSELRYVSISSSSS